MAERMDNDLKTMQTADIENALKQLLAAERLVSGVKVSGEKIGFHA